jgi:amine acid ABC transporter, permease protein, 3-TM region, His/Glu/Gln/Arg/opine family
MEILSDTTVEPGPPGSAGLDWSGFPWWLVGIGLTLAIIAFQILTREKWRQGFVFIRQGFVLTLGITAAAFVLATFFGLFIALGRLSKRTVWRQLAMYYIELIRGLPVIVTIFLIALVVIPMISDALHSPKPSQAIRAVVALSIIYAAFIAEVFRAGIESIPSGQREAGESVGLTKRQVMRLVILPQAIRNIMPALGNDLISLLKDSSLASIIAARELTQMTRLWTGSSFQFRAGYLTLTAFYLSLTVALSLLLRWYERRIAVPH